jgi:hypothetical protein
MDNHAKKHETSELTGGIEGPQRHLETKDPPPKSSSMFSPPYAFAPIGATHRSAPSSTPIANCLKNSHLLKFPCNPRSTDTGHPSCFSSPRLPFIHREVDGRRAGRSSNTEAPYYVLSNEIFERQDIATVTTRHDFGRLASNGYSDTGGHQRSCFNSREHIIADPKFVNKDSLSYRKIFIGRITKVTSSGPPPGPLRQQRDRGD